MWRSPILEQWASIQMPVQLMFFFSYHPRALNTSFGQRYGVKKDIPFVFTLGAVSPLASSILYLCSAEATTTWVMARAYRYPRHFLGPIPNRKSEPGSSRAPLANRSGSKLSGFFQYCSEKLSEWVSTQTGVWNEERELQCCFLLRIQTDSIGLLLQSS